MELIVMEMFSFLLVLIVLMSRRTFLPSAEHDTQRVISEVSIAYCIYLGIAVIAHLQMLGYVSYGSFGAKVVIILHTVSIPMLLYLWMTRIEERMLNPRVYAVLKFTQVSLLLVFLLASFVDISIGKLFVFSPASQVIGGYGMRIMMYLSLLFILVELSSVLSSWEGLERSPRFVYLLTGIFFFVSLLLFWGFKQPYMFALTSTFMLFVSYLSWQRREDFLDSLTRVANNKALLESLKRWSASQRQGTLLMLDIENFRSINERYGMEKGDGVLLGFATSLKESFQDGLVFRSSGNRFILMFPRLAHNEIVHKVRTIKDNAGRGILCGGVAISFHVNIAIVEMPFGDNTVDGIVQALNYTMTEIKEKRRQPVIIFNQKLFPSRQRKLDLLSVLRKAVVNHDMIEVYFQPIIEVGRERAYAAEALMRLYDDEFGLISPAEFIPLAEQAGLITQLTTIMLEKVCAFIADNPEIVLLLAYISVNISAEDLANLDSVNRLLDVLEESAVNPAMIALEITESMVVSLEGKAEKAFALFQEKGIRFLLDDFGTGYSNLETLVNLPLTTVKIDRSIAMHDKNDYELLSLISGMLHQLGRNMVIEGIESLEQLDAAKRVNIPYVQGYHYSKPLDEQAFLDYLR